MSYNDELVTRLSQGRISEIGAGLSPEMKEQVIDAGKSIVKDNQEQLNNKSLEESGVTGGEHATVGENMGSPATPGTEAQTRVSDYVNQGGYDFYDKNKDLEPEQD